MNQQHNNTTIATVAAALLVTAIIGAPGCNKDRSRPPAHQSSPSNTINCNPVVARVNGELLYQDELLTTLLPGRGRVVLDELIARQLARQLAIERGLTDTASLVTAEWETILYDMAPNQPRAQQQALLDYMLQSRRMSRAEFTVIVETQALLRALVEPDVIITDDLLHREYESQHGRRVQARLIVTSNLRRIETVQRKLAAGHTFAELVEEFSEDPPSLARHGLIGPFSAADVDIQPELRTATFALNTIGQLSDVITYHDDRGQQWWALLKLETIIPADDTLLDAVAEELKEAIRRRTITTRMQKLQQRLRKAAQLTIIEPLLRGPAQISNTPTSTRPGLSAQPTQALPSTTQTTTTTAATTRTKTETRTTTTATENHNRASD